MVRKYTGRRGGDIVCKEDEEMNEDGTLCVPKKEESVSSSEDEKEMGGRRHRRHRRHTLRVPKGVHVKAKTLKRMLKSKGLKTTGKKSTLRSRARKAHLIGGSA